MVETKDVGKLVINVLGLDDYNNIDNKTNDEMYIVKENSIDDDNAIAGKSYVDTIRKRIYVGSDEPNPSETVIWVDTNDEGVDTGAAANADLSNLSELGKSALYGFFVPNYENKITIGSVVDETWTSPDYGYVYVYCRDISDIVIKDKSSLGDKIFSMSTNEGIKNCGHFTISKDDIIYIDERVGDVEIVFYPLKGI